MSTSLTEHYGAVFARIHAASPRDEFGIDTVAKQVAVLTDAGFGTLRTRAACPRWTI